MVTIENFQMKSIPKSQRMISISYRELILLISILSIIIINAFVILNNYHIKRYEKLQEELLYYQEIVQVKQQEKVDKLISKVDEVVNKSFILIKNTMEEIKRINTDKIENHIGERNFTFNNINFKGYDLPEVYYPGIDTSFYPYMDYRCITARGTETYKINNDGNSYTDELGLRRYKVSENEFSINGQDDYLVAMSTFYKPKNEINSRFLIKTTTGMYTVRTGDEKSDNDTDSMHMFSYHGGKAGIIEWIVQTECLERSIKLHGSVGKSSNSIINGKITHIYRIE